ncbi:hypothetical protein QBZ16_004534 [Prototheca wickerhamii]|uniref:PCI domain-containing protein n=1 Tax=Prototheca wickerhamii TaxID=3111 RepID=A0AAD9ML81_PROWI|nr:hypothetical protein QBZ16_004534 [Prototheca wickerhamii]
MARELATQLEEIDLNSSSAADSLRALLTGGPSSDADTVKVKEAALGRLCDLLVKQGDAESLGSLFQELRPMFATIPKAKTAKIVRTVIDAISRVPGSTELLLRVTRDQVQWAGAEKRSFLRQRLETRLAGLLLETKDFTGALSLLAKLSSEVKKLDDKLLLVDIYLLESQAHHAVKNLPRSRASLTAARASANAVYVPPSTQADLDTQSGLLHLEERDFVTAYSYFYEAQEAYAALGSPRAVQALKYMLLAKVMRGEVADVAALIASKTGARRRARIGGAGAAFTAIDADAPDVAAVRAVSGAYERRSLHDFQAALGAYGPQLAEDANVVSHLKDMYETMLEQNLLRHVLIIEPYSRVEVQHVAKLIDLPAAKVETKLSQMILDKLFAGTLDQGNGLLEVWEQGAKEEVFPLVLGAFESLGRSVEHLQDRSIKLVAAS